MYCSINRPLGPDQEPTKVVICGVMSKNGSIPLPCEIIPSISSGAAFNVVWFFGVQPQTSFRASEEDLVNQPMRYVDIQVWFYGW